MQSFPQEQNQKEEQDKDQPKRAMKLQKQATLIKKTIEDKPNANNSNSKFSKLKKQATLIRNQLENTIGSNKPSNLQKDKSNKSSDFSDSDKSVDKKPVAKATPKPKIDPKKIKIVKPKVEPKPESKPKLPPLKTVTKPVSVGRVKSPGVNKTWVNKMPSKLGHNIRNDTSDLPEFDEEKF